MFEMSLPGHISIEPPEGFWISEEDKVVNFITTRLDIMQQRAVKALVQAWIKGICPHKRRLFQYGDRKLEHGGSNGSPGWWPRTSECPFVSPDRMIAAGKPHRDAHRTIMD
jgi:hypothetical protein